MNESREEVKQWKGRSRFGLALALGACVDEGLHVGRIVLFQFGNGGSVDGAANGVDR